MATLTTVKPRNIDTTGNYVVNSLSASANVVAGNIKTDNLLYSNGSPYVFTTSASGSNTQIQFNDNGQANGSAGLTFDKTSNTVSIGGASYSTITFTTTGTSTQTIDSWLLNTYRTAQYLTSVTDNTANNYQNETLQLINDGANVLITEYARSEEHTSELQSH